jgi:hypothetical protein
LPKNNPKATPPIIGDKICCEEKPSMRTPELAKAKIGKMKKLTVGEIL